MINYSAEEYGWQTVRLAVLRRDGGCVAVQFQTTPNPDSELCSDQWGTFHPYNDMFKLQLDHVDEAMTYMRKAPDDAAHLQAVCAYHHRVWATRKQNRADSRERLARLYPEVWKREG